MHYHRTLRFGVISGAAINSLTNDSRGEQSIDGEELRNRIVGRRGDSSEVNHSNGDCAARSV
jgi:hypothetical protein